MKGAPNLSLLVLDGEIRKKLVPTYSRPRRPTTHTGKRVSGSARNFRGFMEIGRVITL